MNLHLEVVLDTSRVVVNTTTTGGVTDFRFTKTLDTGQTDVAVDTDQLRGTVERFGNDVAKLVQDFRRDVALAMESAHDTAFEEAMERAKGDED